MITIFIFFVSLALIIALITVKGWEIDNGRKIFLEKWFDDCDQFIFQTLNRIKYWWSHVNFQNACRAYAWLVKITRKTLISIKRRFDHKEHHFFTKRDSGLANKETTSFFLKNVSDYKKDLRNKPQSFLN